MSTAALYYAIVAAVASVLSATWVAFILFAGQPPTHCHYFVPVITNPGVYSCSAYPRPVKP